MFFVTLRDRLIVSQLLEHVQLKPFHNYWSACPAETFSQILAIFQIAHVTTEILQSQKNETALQECLQFYSVIWSQTRESWNLFLENIHWFGILKNSWKKIGSYKELQISMHEVVHILDTYCIEWKRFLQLHCILVYSVNSKHTVKVKYLPSL